MLPLNMEDVSNGGNHGGVVNFSYHLFSVIFRFFFNFMSESVLPACVHVHHGCAVPVEVREGVRCLGTGDMNGCEPPWEPLCMCDFCKSNGCF